LKKALAVNADVSVGGRRGRQSTEDHFLLGGLDRVCKIFALRQEEKMVIQMSLAKVFGQRAGRQGEKGETKPVARAYGLR